MCIGRMWAVYLAVYFLSEIRHRGLALAEELSVPGEIKVAVVSRNCGLDCWDSEFWYATWPYWQVACVEASGEVARFPIILNSYETWYTEGCVSIGVTSHWDVAADAFEPSVYWLPGLHKDKSITIVVNLVAPHVANIFIDGELFAENATRQPCASGAMLLNTIPSRRQLETDIWLPFVTKEVKEKLKRWELYCRAETEAPADADWYCGSRFHYRTHVLGRAMITSARAGTLSRPGEDSLTTRALSEREDRSSRQNFSSQGYAGPLPISDMRLAHDLEEWYLASRTTSAVPADVFHGGGYFGVASLLESDVWLLYLPDEFRRGLVEECQRAVLEFTGLESAQALTPFVNDQARIYRRGSTVPLHTDRHPPGVETVSCIYHLASSGLHVAADDSEAVVQPKWSALFETHQGTLEEVPFMHPGELLVYEASAVPHGRQGPLLEADEYVNAFIHFGVKALDDAAELT
eukprot:TRINITY_DN44877_c0_g1_i1.p1 TRINITY_DN44877_c0_g1~~TRINITY_DN44877_c0_g1_i1.p1  ORF type:complete len:464 (-),score=55.54 TRINITY_DN44877_c0_g1_i1:43-1434(-)